MENEAESGKFKVKDRRRFAPDGEPLEEPAEAADPGPAGTEHAKAESAETPAPFDAVSEPSADREDSETGGATEAGPSPFSAGHAPMPTASFELLVMSLAMQAELELGTHGEPEEQPPNLDVARHTIDMLAVLQEKTKGNLSFEEQRQLDNAVTMLRFRYVQAVQDLNQKAKA